jgi:hypothetical protein
MVVAALKPIYGERVSDVVPFCNETAYVLVRDADVRLRGLGVTAMRFESEAAASDWVLGEAEPDR